MFKRGQDNDFAVYKRLTQIKENNIFPWTWRTENNTKMDQGKVSQLLGNTWITISTNGA